MVLRFWPYKPHSDSARQLSRLLGALRVKAAGRFRPRARHLVINWGNSSLPQSWRLPAATLNHPVAVSKAANKLSTFQVFLENDVPHPMWTPNKETARAWISLGNKVFCRTMLTARSGRGIIVSSTEEELVNAPLYTLAVPNKHEYRVHIFRGGMIDYAQKRKLSVENRAASSVEVDLLVRSHERGWVFCREGIIVPDRVVDASRLAVRSLGLDFGAVDVCVDREGNPYVFEVNTAPGLTGTTLQKYYEAFRGLL